MVWYRHPGDLKGKEKPQTEAGRLEGEAQRVAQQKTEELERRQFASEEKLRERT